MLLIDVFHDDFRSVACDVKGNAATTLVKAPVLVMGICTYVDARLCPYDESSPTCVATRLQMGGYGEGRGRYRP